MPAASMERISIGLSVERSETPPNHLGLDLVLVQDTFAGEAGEGERGRRSGDDWRLYLPPGLEILPVS